jgi:hypothetical protein
MNRLTSGTVSLFALLLVGACNNDPTSDTNNDQVAQLNASPSTLNVTHGKVSKLQVSAVNEAGNPVSAAYELKSVGPGITVTRDSSFFPIFVGDNNTLTVPPAATTFQYNVSGTDLTASSITVTAAGKDVTIPVIVLPDPTFDTVRAAATQTGPSALDTVTVTLPAPYQAGDAVTISSDIGPGFVISAAAGGNTVQGLLAPGSTIANVGGAVVPYAANIPLTNPIVAPVSVDATTFAGSDSPNTAPTVPLVPADGSTGAFADAGIFTGADITGDGGVGAQYYKFTVAQAGDYTFTESWVGPSDLDPVVCFDAGCATDAFAGTGVDQPEQGTLTLTPGTYYYAAVLFAGAPTGFTISASPAAPAAAAHAVPISVGAIRAGTRILSHRPR